MDALIITIIIYSVWLFVIGFFCGAIIGIKWFSKQISIILGCHLNKVEQKIKNFKKTKKAVK